MSRVNNSLVAEYNANASVEGYVRSLDKAYEFGKAKISVSDMTKGADGITVTQSIADAHSKGLAAYQSEMEQNAKNAAERRVLSMAESPDVDISADIEPTERQYSILRRFIASHGVKDGEFYVDFSNKDGSRAVSYSYDSNVSADKVISDIKYFYANGTERVRCCRVPLKRLHEIFNFVRQEH